MLGVRWTSLPTMTSNRWVFVKGARKKMVVNNRRSEIEIVRDILNLSSKVNGAKKTQILYQTNLSYTQLKDYLSFLIERDFMNIEKNNSSVLYKVTDRGTELLGNINKVISTLEQ